MFGVAYAKIAMTAVVVVAIGGFIWHYQSLVSERDLLRVNNAQLSVAVDTQKQTLSYYKGRVNDIIKHTNLLAESLKDANTTHQMAVKRLDAFRGRLADVAIKRPETATRLANTAYSNVLRNFYKESGGVIKADTNTKGSVSTTKPDNTPKENTDSSNNP